MAISHRTRKQLEYERRTLLAAVDLEAALEEIADKHQIAALDIVKVVGAHGDHGSSTAAVVVDQRHADETSLVAVGGNMGVVVHTQFGGNFLTKEGQDAILEQALKSEWRKGK
jgi:hypothetical protein